MKKFAPLLTLFLSYAHAAENTKQWVIEENKDGIITVNFPHTQQTLTYNVETGYYIFKATNTTAGTVSSDSFCRLLEIKDLKTLKITK